MNVIADICVIPIRGDISLRNDVTKAHQILKDTGLPVQLHAYGTNIEGDIDIVLGAIKQLHLELHNDGVPRISTSIRLGSRTDKSTSIQEKMDAVQQETNTTL